MSIKETYNGDLATMDICRWRQEADFELRAEYELGETPDLRQLAIAELTQRLKAQDEFTARMDEAYLLRFLRAKKFNVDKAFKLLKNYYKCRLICPDKFAPIGVGPRDLKHLYDLRMGFILPQRNPLDGSVIVIAQFGDWTPESGYVPMDSYTPIAMAFDLVQNNPEAQLYGFRMVINLAGLQWRYLQFLTPSVVKALVSCCQDGYPARFKGAHIVNNSYLWNMIYAIAKPLLNYKVRQRLQLHSTDLSTLQEFISVDILPEELGGNGPPMSHKWFTEELYRRHDEYVKYSHFGYDVPPASNNKDSSKGPQRSPSGSLTDNSRQDDSCSELGSDGKSSKHDSEEELDHL